MNEKQQVLRGKEAAMVLENPAYIAAMEQLRSQVIEAWKAAPIRDVEGQKLLLQLVKLCDKYEGILGGMIENGKLAQNRIDLNSIRDESAGRKMLRRVTG
jgi:urease accessory protein UreF